MKKTISMCLDDRIIKWINKQAKMSKRSISNFINCLLEKQVDKKNDS